MAGTLELVCDALWPFPVSPSRPLPGRPAGPSNAQRGDWILDISCGTGRHILNLLETVRQNWGPRDTDSLTIVGVTACPRRALAARLSITAAGHDHQVVIFCGQLLLQPILAWNGDKLEPARFAHCAGTPPDGRDIPIEALRSTDRMAPLIIPARLQGRRVTAGASSPVTT